MNVLTDSTTGTRYLKNYGRNSSVNNATVYASNHIYHDGLTHSTPCGIVHTLGSDLYSFTAVGNSSGNMSISLISGRNYNIVNTGSTSSDSIDIHTTTAISGIYIAEITIVVNSGSISIGGLRGDTLSPVDIALTTGINKIEFPITSTTTFVMHTQDAQVFNIDFQVDSIKQITLPAASYFHYYGTASKSIKQLSSTIDYGLGLLPVSTTYPLTSSYQYAIAATAPLEAADTAYIDANPEAMYEVQFNGLVLPSGFSSTDIVHFYDGTGGNTGYGYIPDIAIPLGIEEVQNNTFDSGLTSWTTSGSPTVVSGVLTIDKSTSDLAYQTLPNISSGDFTIIEVDIAEIISGTCRVNRGGTIPPDNEIRVTTAGVYALLTNVGNNQIYVNAAEPDAIVKYNSISVRKATAIEIATYTSDVRTNFLNTTYGATNLKLVKDASGRTTGVATALQTYWASDSRQAVTNWTITAPFTVTEECDGVTYTFTSDGNRYADGVADGTYTLPTGTWTLDNTAFDNVTSVSVRGNSQMIDEVVIP